MQLRYNVIPEGNLLHKLAPMELVFQSACIVKLNRQVIDSNSHHIKQSSNKVSKAEYKMKKEN